MIISKKLKRILSATVLFVSLGATAQTTGTTDVKTISIDDYGKWERLNWGTSFSNNGNWLYYGVVTNDNDKTLFIVNTKTQKSKEINNAESARFSENSKWLAYAKVPSGKASKKSKSPNKLGVVNLISNDSLEFLDVVNYKFSGAASYLAMKRQKNNSNTLIVKDLEGGLEVTFGNVNDYVWQDNGTLLAMLISTADKVGNGIQLYNPITGNLKVLDQKDEAYTGLRWRKNSNDLFVLRNNKNENYKENSFDLLYWKDVTVSATQKVFSQNNFANFPKDTKINNQSIQFSDDGNIVYFNTEYRKPTEKKEKDTKKTASVTDDDESPDLEIWNSADAVIIPQQKMNSRFGFQLAAWNVSNNTFYEIENDLVENVRIQTDTDVSIGQDQTPYEFDVMFGRPSADLYVVDTKKGTHKKVVTKANRHWSVSPNNEFFVYLSEDNLHLYNIKKNLSTNSTKNINDQFFDVENDHPTPQKPAFGFAGWSRDSKSFFINSEYDVWQMFTNGSTPRKITNGKENGIVYRYANFDREERYIDVKKPVYFSMRNKLSKASGLANGKLGKEIRTLIYKEASVAGFIKAKESDDMAFVQQTYTQSPNLFLTDITFKSPKQLSNTNTFQKDYAWGKAELITYTNALGKEAQGILYYPANYKKGEKYPMITYIYEKLSDGFHNYIAPSRTNYYNTTVWSQNGYFVLNPDIEFIAGDPGISSTKTLESAVKAVVAKGDVDAKKVGLIGHSWGGYQAAFVPTQTNIFAASVAGAGLTELISMNLAVTPAFGGAPENAHFEVSQERMEVAPWIAPERYLRNSPVMNIETLNTPMLFEVGDNDTNVNWFQGIAYYNAARRAAKPFVLLVYAKEGHGLRNDKNRIDYQNRILRWFGHYLKDEKAEDWVLEGIPYAEQIRRLKSKK